MLVEILIFLACVPLYVLNAFCDKHISSSGKNSAVYNCVKFLICTLALTPVFLTDKSPRFRLGTILCGVACGIIYAVSKTVILKGYEATSVTFMTVCHSSGMIIPCIAGHLFWNEKLSFLSVCGILLAITSIVLLKNTDKNRKTVNTVGFLIGLVVFLTSGGVMITQKLMGLYFEKESVSAYNIYSFAAAFLILSIPQMAKKDSVKNVKTVIAPAVGSAVSLIIISLVMTALAGKIPSVILFPLFNGLGIIFVSVCSAIMFKEKLDRKKRIGLLVGLCGLYLINL